MTLLESLDPVIDRVLCVINGLTDLAARLVSFLGSGFLM
jgi:hypothetical protein